MQKKLVRLMSATAAAVVFAAVAGGASNSASANGWRQLTFEEAERVIIKVREFERAERERRRVVNAASRDWWGGLYLSGAGRDFAIARLIETDGRRYRVMVPRGPTRVNDTGGVYKTGSKIFGWLVADVPYYERFQSIPGSTVVVRHLYGRKRGDLASIRPSRCRQYFAKTSPLTLYKTGLENYLNGRPNRAGCVWGVDGRSPERRRSVSRTHERGEIGSGLGGRR